MPKRKIIKISEGKCNGCGLCIANCREGAIQIIDGKARLISDLFCDGLGACLGYCPQGAITIEEREAEAHDEKRVMGNIAGQFESRLVNWPVQLMLVSPQAPYLSGADILIAADCVAFTYASFHEDLLKGKILLVGCPKLDNVEAYGEKIAQILKHNSIKSITYAHMEVPCCFGLVGIIEDAIAVTGKKPNFYEVVIGIRGERIK